MTIWALITLAAIYGRAETFIRHRRPPSKPALPPPPPTPGRKPREPYTGTPPLIPPRRDRLSERRAELVNDVGDVLATIAFYGRRVKAARLASASDGDLPELPGWPELLDYVLHSPVEEGPLLETRRARELRRDVWVEKRDELGRDLWERDAQGSVWEAERRGPTGQRVTKRQMMRPPPHMPRDRDPKRRQFIEDRY